MCVIDSINFDTDTVDTNRRIVILADEIQRVVAVPNCSTMISSLFEKSSLALYPSTYHLMDSFVMLFLHFYIFIANYIRNTNLQKMHHLEY
jgi:hypothetical protein